MKKLFCLFIMVAFAAATFATTADSTKTDSTKTVKVKGFSKKEYTVITGTDTIKVKPGDTTHVTFAAADSVKATGKTDIQMIGGKATKIKEITAHGQVSWVKADQDLSKPIEMWCDQDDSTSDPIAPGWYGLITLVIVAGGFSFWRFVLRG
ncbi:MAG: hypothetical protein WCP92_05400 [bacterium]